MRRLLSLLCCLGLFACEEGRAVKTPPPPVVEEPAPLPSLKPAPLALPEVRETAALSPLSMTVQASAAVLSDGAPSVDQASEVVVSVDVIGGVGTHELSVELLSPSGATYQVQRKPFEAASHDSVRTEFAVPVAGTFIDSSNLSGEWTARVRVDGTEFTSQHFELLP